MRNISLSLFLFLSLFGFSQITKVNGTVVGEIQIGSQYCYILAENGTSNFYKSTVCSTVLASNSPVTLVFSNRTDGMIDVRTEVSNEIILARLLLNDNNVVTPEILSILPDVNHEMLIFRSQEHLQEFYELIEISVIANSDSSAQMDGKLAEIEALFNGFLSYRKYFNDKYFSRDQSFTDEQITQLEKEDFINNEVLKSLFNSFRFIGIGDSIYYYNDQDEIVGLSESHLEILDDLKVLSREKDNRGTSIFNREANLSTKNEVVLISKKKQIGTKGYVPIDLFYTYQSYPILDHLVESCNPFKKGLKIELNEIYHPNAPFTEGSSTPYNFSGAGSILTINWGDGTTQTINNYDGGYINHVYPSSQNYQVNTVLTFEDLYGDIRQAYDGVNYGTQILFNTETTCAEHDASEPLSVTSGNWKLSAEIWVNHNIFGHHIGAYSHAWKFVNGEWKRRNSRIHVSIDAKFRNDQCEITETKTNSKTHNNDKRIQTVKSKLFKKYKNIGVNDVKSGHSLEEGGTTISFNLVLNPC